VALSVTPGHPQEADGTLVTAEEVLATYPKISGVNLPEGTSRLPRYNYGPGFDSHGIMSVFPPQPFPGQEYPLRVPQVDADGNTLRSALPQTSRCRWARTTAGHSAGPASPRANNGGTRAAFSRSPGRRRSVRRAATPAHRPDLYPHFWVL
jgi:hypothetical protein